MISLEDRRQIAVAIEQARSEGARLEAACEVVGIGWKGGDGLQRGDRRPEALHPAPAHARSQQEREQIPDRHEMFAGQPNVCPRSSDP